jgi:hypothetical protein
MATDLVHVTAYVAPHIFEKMEALRALTTRQTRSQWVEQAIAEKVERDSEKGKAR